MVEENAIQILQFDCTMFGGFTNGKKLSALCELNHLDIAPHHDCYIHAPLVASSPSGRIVESFDDERDPLQACRGSLSSSKDSTILPDGDDATKGA